jgi:hypothetical protein
MMKRLKWEVDAPLHFGKNLHNNSMQTASFLNWEYASLHHPKTTNVDFFLPKQLQFNSVPRVSFAVNPSEATRQAVNGGVSKFLNLGRKRLCKSLIPKSFSMPGASKTL